MAKVNLANMQELIHGALFIRDGVKQDVCPQMFASLQTKMCLQGTMRNMASPALTSLVIECFYTGHSALGKLFPEVFR